MPAGTDVRSRSDACPVCDEPLPGRPERCFRCETTLTGWWSFEEALAGIAPAAAAAVPEPGVTARGWTIHQWSVALGVVLATVAAALIFFVRPRAAVAPGRVPMTQATETTAAPVSRATVAEPAPVVRYRAQRGDSLWRVAAAVTGDGRRWKELWPDRVAADRLRPGEVLEIPVNPPRQ